MNTFRTLRAKLGLSKERTAKELQVTTRTVYRWEAAQAPKVAELAMRSLISDAKRRAEETPGNI